MTKSAMNRALARIAEDNGFDDTTAMLEAAVLDGLCPGVCRACGAEASDVEPDAAGYTCEECGATSVVSVLVAAGVV